MSGERVEILTEEECENTEDEERYTMTPCGCLYAVLLSYGIQISLSDGKEISGKFGEHIMQDLFELLCKAGYRRHHGQGRQCATAGRISTN